MPPALLSLGPATFSTNGMGYSAAKNCLSHEITFSYRNPAFSLGWKISLVCLLLLGIITYAVYFRKRALYRGKYLN